MRQQTAEEFEREVQQITERFGEDNTEALKECDKILIASVQLNFEDSTTARKEAWPIRKASGPTHSLLILTGQLKAAATTGEGEIPDGKTLIRRMPGGPSGTSKAGLRRHEFGDAEILGKPGILARPYYGVSEEAADRCAEKVADHLLEQVVRGF